MEKNFFGPVENAFCMFWSLLRFRSPHSTTAIIDLFEKIDLTICNNLFIPESRAGHPLLKDYSSQQAQFYQKTIKKITDSHQHAKKPEKKTLVY